VCLLSVFVIMGMGVSVSDKNIQCELTLMPLNHHFAIDEVESCVTDTLR
jgi:hypothetical protein